MEAVLDAPDPMTRSGIRDRAMLLIAFTVGLRASELVGLRVADASLQPAPRAQSYRFHLAYHNFRTQQVKQEEDKRVAQEKARLVSKPKFRP